MTDPKPKRPHDVAGGANQPQHLAGEYGGPAQVKKPRDGLPTGENTGPHDVADPHPSNEEHYDSENRPGGAKPAGKQIGTNDAVVQDGPAPRAPKNAENEP